MVEVDKVIFFDGVCNLCNSTVDILIKLDKQHQFRYSSLQGQFAKKALAHVDINFDKSFVYLENGKVFVKAAAAIKILKKLGGIYKAIAVIASVFPNWFLNLFYNLLAKYRYQLLGKKDECRLPSKEEARLFID